MLSEVFVLPYNCLIFCISRFATQRNKVVLPNSHPIETTDTVVIVLDSYSLVDACSLIDQLITTVLQPLPFDSLTVLLVDGRLDGIHIRVSFIDH